MKKILYTIALVAICGGLLFGCDDVFCPIIDGVGADFTLDTNVCTYNFVGLLIECPDAPDGWTNDAGASSCFLECTCVYTRD